METRDSVITKLSKVMELHVADGKHVGSFGKFRLEADEYGITVASSDMIGLLIVKAYGAFNLRARNNEINISEDDYNGIYLGR